MLLLCDWLNESLSGRILLIAKIPHPLAFPPDCNI